jgi:tape measure domain-containing protein
VSDAATFVVSLIDKVTGPAKTQAKSLAALQDQIAKTGKLGTIGMVFKGAGLKAAESTIGAVADKAFSIGKYAALGMGAAGVALGGFLVKGTVEMAMFEDRTKTAFNSLTGSVAGGQKAWQSSLNLSRELGQGVEDTAGAMTHLLAMQFKLPEAEEMVRISADLKAVTGDAHSAERALTAITQIKAKGKLQAEELVGQLAEAGVSTTLVYEQLQKSMNLKSNADVMKAITGGKVSADVGIEAIKNAILHKTHSEKAGAAGEKYAQTTYGGLIGQLKNAPQFLFVRLGEAVAKNLERFKPLVQKVTEAIDNISGDQMTRFVGNVLGFMEKLVPLGLEFAAGFGEGFSAMNDAMGGVGDSTASMATARDLGKALASAFEMAFKAIKMVADLVLWLDEHRGVAAGVAGMLAIDKVAGGGATAKALWTGGKGLLAGGQALAGGAGLAGAAKTALGLGTAATAATTTAGTAAATGAGTSGLAALTGGLGVAGAAAGGAALVGVGAAAVSYAYREEIANWMLGLIGNKDQAAQRGLGAPQPTAALNGLQGATAKATTNNVKFESSINIDGANHDPNEIARTVSDGQRGMMEQFFQSQALESGATG